jgi:hypothetical protein
MEEPRGPMEDAWQGNANSPRASPSPARASHRFHADVNGFRLDGMARHDRAQLFILAVLHEHEISAAIEFGPKAGGGPAAGFSMPTQELLCRHS